MLENHGERWGDKVRIIGISDKEPVDTVVNHVNSKCWTKVNHFHQAASNCKEIYNVKGIPHIILVDKNGNIAFYGHPSDINLDDAIEKLLNDEVLPEDLTLRLDYSHFKEMDIAKID